MQSPYKNYKTTAGIQLLASSSTTTDSSGIAETRLLSAIKATDHAAVVSSRWFYSSSNHPNRHMFDRASCSWELD